MQWIVAALLLVCPMAAFGLDNSVTIVENTGAAQQKLPVTVMAALARGEVPEYARPAVTILDRSGSVIRNRAVAQHWQSDIKTRWRDGVATLEIASVSNPEEFTCPAETLPCASSPLVRIRTRERHDFRDGERIRIDDSPVPGLNGEWTVLWRTDEEFSLAGLGHVTNPGSGGTVKGPASGSWATGLVTLFIDELPAGGRARIDFVNDSAPSHDPAHGGMRLEELLERKWAAQMEVSTPAGPGTSGKQQISARGIIDSASGSHCPFEQWLSGPLVTEWIIDNRCSSRSDFGWRPVRGVVAAGELAAEQSSGSQTLTLNGSPEFAASEERPALAQYMTGGPSLLGSRYEAEFFWICGINGGTARICPDGRGAFGSSPRTIPSGAQIGILQGVDGGTAFHNLHPWFHVRAYSSPDGSIYPGVRIRYGLSNGNLDRPLTSYVAVSLQSSSGRIRWQSGLGVSDYGSRPAEPFFFQAGSEISKVFWDGEDPEHFCPDGETDPCPGQARQRRWLLDINLPYKTHAGFILPVDEQAMDTTGSKSPFLSFYNAFAAGDRGEVGTPLNQQGKHGYKNYPYSIRITGYSNYSNRDDIRTWAGGADEDREEAWIWSRALARTLPVLGSEPRAWEILFGTSLPGGAGLQAVEHHLPMNWWEGNASLGERPFTTSTCPECPAFGRLLSVDVRPTLYVLKPDAPGQARDQRMNYAATGAWQPSMWYDLRAPGVFLVGPQTLDNAHREPHAPYLYLVTGDYYDLRQTQSWAAWLVGFKNPDSATPDPNSVNGWNVRHGSWSSQVTATGHVRASAWPILALGWAAALSPNTRQPGGAMPPERPYFENKLANTFAIWEGMTGMTSGRFPPRDASCQGIGPRYDSPGLNVRTTNDMWCWGRLEPGRNVPMPLHITARPDIVDPLPGSARREVDTSVVGGMQSPFTLAQVGIALWQTQRLGNDLVTPLFERHGRMSMNLFLNQQIANVFVATRYHWPWTASAQPSGEGAPKEPYGFFTSWGALRKTFLPPGGDLTNWEASTRLNLEYGYAHYWRASLAAWVGTGLADRETAGCTPAEVPPEGCTANEAYRVLAEIVPDQAKYKDQKRVAQVPAQRISVGRVEAASSSGLSVRIQAGPNDRCTSVWANEPLASSLDEGPNVSQFRTDSSGIATLTLPVNGEAERIYLRVTCGATRTSLEIHESASAQRQARAAWHIASVRGSGRGPVDRFQPPLVLQIRPVKYERAKKR